YANHTHVALNAARGRLAKRIIGLKEPFPPGGLPRNDFRAHFLLLTGQLTEPVKDEDFEDLQETMQATPNVTDSVLVAPEIWGRRALTATCDPSNLLDRFRKGPSSPIVRFIPDTRTGD